jgi:hypothetical protein
LVLLSVPRSLREARARQPQAMLVLLRLLQMGLQARKHQQANPRSLAEHRAIAAAAATRHPQLHLVHHSPSSGGTRHREPNREVQQPRLRLHHRNSSRRLVRAPMERPAEAHAVGAGVAAADVDEDGERHEEAHRLPLGPPMRDTACEFNASTSS